MSPHQTSGDFGDCAFGQRVVGCDGSIRFGQRSPSNLSDVRICDLRAPVLLPATHPLGMKTSGVIVAATKALGMRARPRAVPARRSPSRFPLLVVEAFRPEVQVAWTNAQGCVAVVEDAGCLGRRHPAGEYPRDSMGTPSPGHAALSVSLVVGDSCPDPTLPQVRHVLRDWTVLVDLRPKAVGGTLSISHAEPPSKVRWLGLADRFNGLSARSHSTRLGGRSRSPRRRI